MLNVPPPAAASARSDSRYPGPAVRASPPAPNRSLSIFGPLFGICCILIGAFLIAATIVLALIPIYLPKQTTSTDNTVARTAYLTGDYDGSIGDDGALSPEANTAIGNAIAPSLNLPANQVSVTSGTVATTPTGRRRRRLYSLIRNRRGQTPFGIQRIYLIIRLLLRRNQIYVLPTGPFVRTISFPYRGRTVTIVLTFTFSATPITIPPTLGPTSGTTTVSIATTTSTAGPGTTTTTAGPGTTTTTAGPGTTTTTTRTTTTATAAIGG